jgi:ABC-type sugar transport system ATPase subunit
VASGRRCHRARRARESKLVILDEPTAALGRADQQVLRLVRRLADRGLAVI